MQPFCVWYICTSKNMYRGVQICWPFFTSFIMLLFTYRSLLSRYWTHAGLLSNFPLWSSQFPLFSLPQKTPMSRQTWYSISKWRNPKEYFSEFFITILSNYIKRDEITSFSFLIESWMVNSEPKLFESPNINIDFIHVCKLIKRKISAIWRSITKNVPRSQLGFLSVVLTKTQNRPFLIYHLQDFHLTSMLRELRISMPYAI